MRGQEACLTGLLVRGDANILPRCQMRLIRAGSADIAQSLRETNSWAGGAGFHLGSTTVRRLLAAGASAAAASRARVRSAAAGAQ